MSATIVPTGVPLDRKTTPAVLRQAARKAVFNLLGKLKQGRIQIDEDGAVNTFGPGLDGSAMAASLTVHDPQFYVQVLLGGSVGAGEAYMAGMWSSHDVAKVVEVIAANPSVKTGMDSGWMRLYLPFHHLFNLMRRNTLRGSRKNILAHYDLGESFYRLFLDDTMTYSCAYFPDRTSSLEAAQRAKYDRICDKLRLTSEDHLLEIGSGWGGFAIHAASRSGCRVTTTTISDEQFKSSRRRIEAAGLSEKITVIKKDYRQLKGQYDKLVSIEMIEAVGHQYLDHYFETCADLLKPDGAMLLQAIIIADQYYEAYKRSVDFIKRYIFPGGCLPSINAISHSITRQTDLRIFHLEDITDHYARTLSLWGERFLQRLEQVRALGFNDMFVRMWDFYFSYCEGGFRSRHIGDVQMLLVKPMYRHGALSR